MTLRAFIAALLIVNTHVSLCAGKLLSVSAVFAAELPSVENSELIVMSKAFTDGFACTHEIDGMNQSAESEDTPEAKGCSDSDACVQHAASIEPLLQIVLGEFEEVDSSFRLGSNHEFVPEPSFVLARAGPLFEQASTLSHSHIKLE